MRPVSVALATAVLAAGCGGSPPEPPARVPPPVPIGAAATHQPSPVTALTRRAAPVGGLRCSRSRARRFGVHVEVFGDRQTVILAAGIGVAPPWRGRAPYVTGGRCSYPLRTREPTGVVEVAEGTQATLGDLFDLWGQPLGPRRVGAFRGRTRVWVGGRPHAGDPRAVRLTRHAQIVVSPTGGVPVHASYVFPPGL